MADRTLKPLPLTPERFALYGDVIAPRTGERADLNEARFELFEDLARIDVDTAGGGRPAVAIARSRVATRLPYRIDMVERHPLGSQAFIPLSRFRFIVVVGAPGESVAAEDLEAFVTNGRQGINYHRGTWHMPLVALAENQEFLVIDRAGRAENCQEHVLADAIVLEAP